jgi:hypothetical protein
MMTMSVAQRGNLLHDVGGQHHAVALTSQFLQEFAQGSGGHDIQAVGGSSSRTVRGWWIRARAIATLTRWPWEKPSVRRSMNSPMSSTSANSSMRWLDGGLVQALQPAVIGDVLACGQSVVQAARIRHHAQGALDLQRFAFRIDAIDAHVAGIGLEQGIEHAQGGGLASAIGAEQAGDLAVFGGEADFVDGHDLALVEGLSQTVCFDHGVGPSRLMKNGSWPSRSMHSVSSSAEIGLVDELGWRCDQSRDG